MLRTEPYTATVADGDPPKLSWHAPVVGELTPDQALSEALITQHEALAISPQVPGIGHNSAGDPLASRTPWWIYQRCIWVSDEDANIKISLLCLSRFMDKDLRAASMSYTQWARDCGFSEPTAKRCAKAVAGTWLTIGIGKGRYVAGKGHENLYNGRIPQKWADELRRRILGGIAVTPDEAVIEAVDGAMEGESGVSHRHPDGSRVSGRHPENEISGYQGDTGVSATLERGITQTPVHLISHKDNTAVPPERADTSKSPKKKPKRSQIADDWQPSAEAQAWVQSHYVATDRQIAEQAALFRNYHQGKGSLMADWAAAWRTWWGNGFHKLPRRTQEANGSDLDPRARAEALRRLRAI
jgi:hypothetical protein